MEDRHEILKAIQNYPDHPAVGDAWQVYYERYKEEVGDNEASLDEFLKRHEDFPYPELIVEDKKKITDDAIDEAIETGGWKDCVNLAVQNPAHPRNRALWRRGVDLFLAESPSYENLNKFKRQYSDCPFMSEIEEATKKAEAKKRASRSSTFRYEAKPKNTEGIFGLINTPYDEYVPVMTADGKYLYFFRPNQGLQAGNLVAGNVKNPQALHSRHGR